MTPQVDAVLLDIDGVLTDGSILVDDNGREFKRIIFDDIDAFFRMRRAGLRLGFITGEDTPFCAYVQRRFQPDFFIAGCKDKDAAFEGLCSEHGLRPERTCYVGDSRHDIALLKRVASSFVPLDAEPVVRAAAAQVLPVRRGHGVICALASLLLGDESGSADAKLKPLP
jgi:YrbI family 3-deoxy-D-manno-octulosonate 8-phosphate phosphatase